MQKGIVYEAYNNDGQLLLNFTPFCGNKSNDLEYGSGGRWLYGYADDSNINHLKNYLFSGRRRLIQASRDLDFLGIDGGDYVRVYDYSDATITLQNWDGDVLMIFQLCKAITTYFRH
ncbi:MAG: hypothetical protein CVU98_00760 [Firmicutes bacterium HGW-Firmicutes-3]|nr:MAG: hypothetical protein CVU98_00760 [Firmicutes bacterium HGW-Firmicutes-3]